jgi:hypothetical protein
MLEICVPGVLVVSLPVSVLIWLVLASAKQADRRVHGSGHPFLIEPEEGPLPPVTAIPSGNH